MQSSSDDEDRDELEFYCRHLVALFIIFQELNEKKEPNGEMKSFLCSGLIINVRGYTYFLTAGHALQRWDDLLREEKVIIHSSALIDTFGSNASSSQPIPFDFLNESKFYIDNEDEGLDFGLIMLRSHYTQLLEKNGIVAIFEKNWIHQNDVEYHSYSMLGIPNEFNNLNIHKSDNGGLRISGTVSPTLIHLQKMDILPDNVKKTKYERFVGKLDPNVNLESLVGMSGGPIFGFNLVHPIRYWVVAIQSSWLKNRKITFGCPLPVLANLLTEWTNEISKTGVLQR
jgi:hypothetical protein